MSLTDERAAGGQGRSRQRRSTWKRLALALGVLGALGRAATGCATPEPVTADDICDDARRGIALRTQSCTQDVALANRRYDLAKAKLTCKPMLDLGSTGYGCSSTILARSCEEATTFGDDLDAWASSEPCRATFERAFSQDPNNPTVNQACSDDGNTCACKILVGAKNEGRCEAPAANDGQEPLCCKTGDYPNAGSCNCRGVQCLVTGSEDSHACQCLIGATVEFGTPTRSCNRTSFPELQQGSCCLDLGSRRCECSKNASCTSEQTPVSSCDADVFCTDGLGAEKVRVTQCSL